MSVTILKHYFSINFITGITFIIIFIPPPLKLRRPQNKKIGKKNNIKFLFCGKEEKNKIGSKQSTEGVASGY